MLVLTLILPFASVKTNAANGLSASQEKFLAEISDIATKVMKTSRILASVTIAQAIWESGWGQSNLAKKTNNYFGFTVGSSWKGPIYCTKNDSFYSSREEAISILGSTKYNYWASGGDNGVPGFWRVYSSMEESVRDHNTQLSTSSYYAGIPGETDYKVVAKILNKYYCSDNSYASAIISTIENYELYKYDTTDVWSDVPTSIILGVKSLVMKPGETHALTATVYPSSAKDKTVTYSSSNTKVATVSAAGVIKAVSAGTATITAKTSNGITADVSVYCSKDGEITYSGTIVKSVYCRASKADGSARLGVFGVGAEVLIHGDSDDGLWYHVSGTAQSGETVSGYIYVTCVSGVKPYEPTTPSNPSTPSNPTTPSEPQNPTQPSGKKYTGVVTYAAYVRTEPNATTADKLGIIPIGNEVIIYGDKTGDFYYGSGTTADGKNLTGYLYANCIRISGEVSGNTGSTQFTGDDGLNYRFATTISSLNCRKGPATSYDLLGTFNGGTTLIVCGEGVSGSDIDGVWYYVKGVDKNGKAVTGYCGGDYIRLGDRVLESVGCTIDSNYIFGISAKTTSASLASLSGKLKFTATNANGGAVASNKPIGTGHTVTVEFNGMKLFAKKAIVTGDLDGDGRIASADYIRIRLHLIGKIKIDGAELKAADADGNGKISSSDYIKVRRIILGME